MKEKPKEDAALRLCMRKSFVEHGNECEQEGRQDQPHTGIGAVTVPTGD